ncbi:MAG TPA: DNA translocase FtsK 4TM domain-containing protein, partial [Caulobacteraceae bacterium]|nr:DNA translocase FtsK 4TM domain-containing protein [Caulobacteraceae bacterium]
MARRSAVAIAARGAHAGWTNPTIARLRGGMVAALGIGLICAFATYRVTDPSLDVASDFHARNLLGGLGADAADLGLQTLGLTAWLIAGLMVAAGLTRVIARDPGKNRSRIRWRVFCGLIGALTLAGMLAALLPPANWPLAGGLGGFVGELVLDRLAGMIGALHVPESQIIAAAILGLAGFTGLAIAAGAHKLDRTRIGAWLTWRGPAAPAKHRRTPAGRKLEREAKAAEAAIGTGAPPALEVKAPKPPPRESSREARENQGAFEFAQPGGFRLPELAMLAKPKPRATAFDEEALRQNARMLESVLAEFGVKGTVDQIRPGPVVTLYELSPAPGVKHARVVALSDDIA